MSYDLSGLEGHTIISAEATDSNSRIILKTEDGFELEIVSQASISVELDEEVMDYVAQAIPFFEVYLDGEQI